MLPASRRRQGVSSAHPQWHQGFDQTFAQGPRSGVEAGSRREPQISAGEESTRRGARRGIYPIQKTTGAETPSAYPGCCSYLTWYALGEFRLGKYLIATVNRASALSGTGCTRAGPCLGA